MLKLWTPCKKTSYCKIENLSKYMMYMYMNNEYILIAYFHKEKITQLPNLSVTAG